MGFFTIIGIIVVGLFLLRLAVLLFVRYVLRKAVVGLASGAATMQSEIHCMPLPPQSWERPDVAEAAAEFAALGFQRVGCFSIPEAANTEVFAHVLPERSVWGTVYCMKGRVFSDVYTHLTNGGNITVGNSSSPALDPPPRKQNIKMPGAKVVDLVSTLVERRGDPEANPTTGENWQAAFEGAYREEMAWRKSRGGATERKIRAVAAAEGREVSDGEVSLAREALKEASKNP